MIRTILLGLLPVLVLCWLLFPAWRRAARGNWRPAVGMAALVAFMVAVGAAIYKQIPLAVFALTLGLSMALSARRESRQGPVGSRGQAPKRRRGGMSPEQARELLGVAPDATMEQIQAAYLRLIRRNHPDQGGSTGLAAQLNAARDVLLGKD